MLVIDDTLVSLDVVEQFFVCDLSVCKGQCCIDGDAGAPISADEKKEIEKHLPEILPLLTPGGRRAVETDGVAYFDCEGDLVTTLVEGKNCAFTTYDENGTCLCALEKGYRQGLLPYLKPSSCALYPVRLKKIGNMTALNFHKWKICGCARKKGKNEGVRAYEFLKEPLIRKFGQKWYDNLSLAAGEWIKQQEG